MNNINNGTPPRKFNTLFQIRWREEFGLPEDPYVRRWTLILFGYSIRLHHWIRSDDNRYFHDHSCDLISIPLKGFYYNNIPASPDNLNTRDAKRIQCDAGTIWKAKAEGKHFITLPKGKDAWSLVLFGRPRITWGFYVNNNPKKPTHFSRWRTNRYYKKFGIIQTSDYTGEFDD